MNWRDHLLARLRDMQPASVCTLDAAAHRLARGALPDAPLLPLEPPPDSPCVLALGIDILNGLNAQQAEHLISRIRTYVAPRLLLAAQPGCTLDEAAFRALGFALTLTDTTENVRVYHYDLDTYKTVPDWLNSRHWAHPERWKP